MIPGKERMVKLGLGIVAIGIIAVIASACAGTGSDKEIDSREAFGDVPLVYLQEEIPVCSPVAGSERDPCAVRGAPNLPSFSDIEYLEVPNYWDLYHDPDGPLFIAYPHLVMRATFVPNTTRCSLYERTFPAFLPFDFRDSVLMCFVDARVNDYVVGTGPPTLTLAAFTLVVGGGSVFDFEQYRASTARAYEGREGVMFLAPSATTVVEAWWMTEFWDVQRTGEAVSVVAPYRDYFEAWRSRFTEEDLALLERPLSEFEKVIKEGAVARVAETGGRIAVGDDLPMLITDANLLRPYYEGPGVGISYETDAPLLPPPVPGGEDPEQPPVTTGEEDDGSSGTVPVPDGEDQPDSGGSGAGP